MSSPIMAVAHSTAIIGRLVCESNKPMQLDAAEPIPICRKPDNAAALPVFLLKGARQSAEALGVVSPRQDKSTKKNATVILSVVSLCNRSRRKAYAVATWKNNAYLKSDALL